MSYLEEFRHLIAEEKVANFLRIWEEYCMADEVDGEELTAILELIKSSKLARYFGQVAETALPQWKSIENKEDADNVLRLILDLQTTNIVLFADLATDFLKEHYSDQADFSEKMRIVGLRSRHSFQGAISNYELLTHMNKGAFVFHTGGWGVGEVMEMSLLREHAVFEFEGVSALKDLSFDNAFKNLIKLPSDHFLSRRFGDPDTLEKEGREDPVVLIRHLLKDLGPKSAQEIKEELCELVIPEEDWTKWWQQARSKAKKDTKIQSPKTAREKFILRDSELTHDERFKGVFEKIKDIDDKIQTIYNFIRDFPEILKNFDLKQQIKTELKEALEENPNLPETSKARKLQATYLLEDIFPEEYAASAPPLVKELENVEETLNLIEILAFKKRTLTTVRKTRDDWGVIFLRLLFSIPQNPIRDYIFKELLADQSTQPLLGDKIHDLLHKVTLFPDAFYWYFQKLANDEAVPMNDPDNKRLFFEALMVLLHFIEHTPEHRELVKKTYQILTAKRYAVIRAIIDNASVDYLREWLLLASKCHTFSKHDLKIFQNLSEVVQPSLAKKKEEKKDNIIWTTPEGYKKIQERIQHIGTVETIDNAREIEEARAHGDLRENAEYKFALERRARLQGELKSLSEQLNRARILTKDDIEATCIGVGAIVNIINSRGKKSCYTLLGPWEADPERNILSFQSKLAEAMTGCKAGESFTFQEESYTVEKIKSFL